MSQRFGSGPPGHAPMPGQPRYQPPPPQAPGMRPYAPPNANFAQRGFPMRQSPAPGGPATNSPGGGPVMHQRPSQPGFQSGLRGSGTGGGNKRTSDARSMANTVTKNEFVAAKKKRKLADKILPQKVRDLVPESQAYMDLLTFERKLDATIMRKRLDIQEALKRPMKQKRKLRIFISNTFYPSKEPSNEGDGSVKCL